MISLRKKKIQVPEHGKKAHQELMVQATKILHEEGIDKIYYSYNIPRDILPSGAIPDVVGVKDNFKFAIECGYVSRERLKILNDFYDKVVILPYLSLFRPISLHNVPITSEQILGRFWNAIESNSKNLAETLMYDIRRRLFNNFITNEMIKYGFKSIDEVNKNVIFYSHFVNLKRESATVWFKVGTHGAFKKIEMIIQSRNNKIVEIKNLDKEKYQQAYRNANNQAKEETRIAVPLSGR